MGIQRIKILDVPVDILRPEDLEIEILELLAKPGTKQIVFLSIWDLLKARHRGEFQDCINNADLIIPISKSIISGANFLKKEIPIRYNPFSAVINILSVLDSHFKSLYLLGSRGQTLHSAEKNLRATYPNLRIVGRYVGYYPKNMENDIVQSIYKSSPSLVLVSEGIKEKNCWSYKRRNQFSSSIFIYYRDAFGIFSKRIKREDEKTFERGHEIFHEIIRNPFKIFLVLPFIKYLLTLFFYKILKK